MATKRKRVRKGGAKRGTKTRTKNAHEVYARNVGGRLSALEGKVKTLEHTADKQKHVNGVLRQGLSDLDRRRALSGAVRSALGLGGGGHKRLAAHH
jgi:hypothetical protein